MQHDIFSLEIEKLTGNQLTKNWNASNTPTDIILTRMYLFPLS